MAQCHRLRRLQVREPGHDGGGLGLRPGDEDRLQALQVPVQSVQGVAHPHLEIGGHLVVARARRMQAAGGLAHQLGQARLDVHVDVLQGALELETAVLDLGQDVVQAADDGIAVLLRYNAPVHQHGRVGLGAGDVLGVKALVHVDRGVDLLHHLGGPRLEASAPEALAALSFSVMIHPRREASE